MSTAINYASKPLGKSARVVTGDTSRTAPAVTVTLVSAADCPSGAWIERLQVMRLATTIKTVVRIWKYDVANVTYHLHDEIDIGALTLTTTDAVKAITRQAVEFPSQYPFTLPVGWELRASVNDTTGSMEVSPDGGGY